MLYESGLLKGVKEGTNPWDGVPETVKFIDHTLLLSMQKSNEYFTLFKKRGIDRQSSGISDHGIGHRRIPLSG